MQSSNQFTDLLQDVFNKVCHGDPLKPLREKAWDHFLELGLPDKKSEAFQYLPLKQLYEKSFALKPSEFKEKIPHSIVFTNGVFRPELSDLSSLPQQVVVLPMLDAMRSYGTFLQNRLSKTLREENDPFSILNQALYPQGLFIYVPPKVVLETPIQCVMLSEGDATLSFPRIQIFVASDSEVKWISKAEGSGWMNSAIDIALEDSSRFYHYDTTQKFQGWRFNHFRATLKRSSLLESVTITEAEAICRNSFRIGLGGEGATATLQGLWKLKEKHQAHTHVVMEHSAPNCHSLQKFKGVLADTSQSSFEGKILVRDIAQKTQAYQLNHNLLLGEYATAYTKPNLQIFADDVKASHGATISQVDEEQLFYLKSRGLPETQAKQLLIEGFCKEISNLVPQC
jgi:Fe-S cluster assembly protein SufD